ncbi:MAG: lipoyl(octanoyl) transferase LipB [Planctomycetota bacterium]|jgi:lipoate-protein ligase B
MAELISADVGRRSYAEAMELQAALRRKVAAADAELAYLLLVEHDPPVITLGRSAKDEHIRVSADELRRAGIEVRETTRGGDVTYHAPGQLVGYPIIRLDLHGRDVRGYLRDLEEALIRTVGRFGIAAGRRQGLTGVWVGREKLAAIGVAVRKWVTYHGFALNVAPEMSGFEKIVPCGLVDYDVTSMARLLGRQITVAEVKPTVIECLVEVFGFDRAVEGDVDS